MTIKYRHKYLRIAAVFLIFFFVSINTSAHDDMDSHKIFKGIGDGYRTLMDSKNGMGGSLFILYVEINSSVINGTSKGLPKNLTKQLGTAFIPDCVGCDGRFLLTNKHVADVDETKKEYDEHIRTLLNFPQGVRLHITESYKAVDSNGITFLVSRVPVKPNPIDAALFRFEKESIPPRKSFILQDEKEISFSPVVALGSPFNIPNMLAPGNLARAELHDCDGNKQRYVVLFAPINPGNSGGPIFNMETDKVNAMTTEFLLREKDNSMIVCAVPASALIQFLKENVPSQK